MSCLLTVTLHIVDVRLTCLINITYLLTYLTHDVVEEFLCYFRAVEFTVRIARNFWTEFLPSLRYRGILSELCGTDRVDGDWR